MIKIVAMMNRFNVPTFRSPFELGSHGHKLNILQQMVENFQLYGDLGIVFRDGSLERNQFVTSYVEALMISDGGMTSSSILEKYLGGAFIAKEPSSFRWEIMKKAWDLNSILRELSDNFWSDEPRTPEFIQQWKSHGGFYGLSEEERVQIVLTNSTSVHSMVKMAQIKEQLYDEDLFTISLIA